MTLSVYAESQSFFESSCEVADVKFSDFESIRGRARCLFILLEKVIVLPFALFFKLYKTSFRFLGLALSASLLLVTLGASVGIREFFVRRVCSIARDFADWILYPFAVFSCFSKLILAAFVHPGLYFQI